MLLSNFKISFQSHGSSVCIIKPEDEQIHFTHPAKVALIASTSDKLCAQASQLMQQFATEQGIKKYLLLNEGYVAAIGVQAVKKAIRPQSRMDGNLSGGATIVHSCGAWFAGHCPTPSYLSQKHAIQRVASIYPWPIRHSYQSARRATDTGTRRKRQFLLTHRD